MSIMKRVRQSRAKELVKEGCIVCNMRVGDLTWQSCAAWRTRVYTLPRTHLGLELPDPRWRGTSCGGRHAVSPLDCSAGMRQPWTHFRSVYLAQPYRVVASSQTLMRCADECCSWRTRDASTVRWQSLAAVVACVPLYVDAA